MGMPGLLQLGDVAIGAAIRTGERAGETLTRLRDQARARIKEARLDDLTDLAELGASERNRVIENAITALATSRIVDRVVEIQLARVLELLEREPDRIRALMRGQRDSMVGDVVGRVRAGAAAGDAVVDRITLRMTGRGQLIDPTT
ncbi:hypothetical protein KZ829_07525 [Actinoplanes hulinensis]|uniref:Uncharacterized protein n=1 Tax=Actinoplanes hulinensis TaxID=1144547 RepID=A0ABS7AYE3_9ACTN|nr:hypothetical protein [Actinoplanes hulinensis]MBW6433594.1 hypothetical protein [Actinoplanes hulinensis]